MPAKGVSWHSILRNVDLQMISPGSCCIIVQGRYTLAFLGYAEDTESVQLELTYNWDPQVTGLTCPVATGQ